MWLCLYVFRVLLPLFTFPAQSGMVGHRLLTPFPQSGYQSEVSVMSTVYWDHEMLARPVSCILCPMYEYTYGVYTGMTESVTHISLDHGTLSMGIWRNWVTQGAVLQEKSQEAVIYGRDGRGVNHGRCRRAVVQPPATLQCLSETEDSTRGWRDQSVSRDTDCSPTLSLYTWLLEWLRSYTTLESHQCPSLPFYYPCLLSLTSQYYTPTLCTEVIESRLSRLPS